MRWHSAISKKPLLVGLLACSVALALAGQRVAEPLRHAAQFVLAPLGDAPMYAVTHLGEKLADSPSANLSPEQIGQIQAENEYLRRLTAYWRAQSEVFEQQAQRLANFQRMYGPTRDLACELIPAKVIGGGSLSYDRTRVVSPGGQGGVRAGSVVLTRDLATARSKALPARLAVVNAVSLVGRIVDSGAFTARLQLVTDRGFEMPGRIRRIIVPGKPRMVTITDANLPRQTILTPGNNAPIDVYFVGDGATRVLVPDVKEYYKVQPGDLLTTGAKAENLPTELHVGQVEKVEIDKRDPRRVVLTVRPYQDVNNVRDVFILSPVAPAPAKP